MTKETFLTTSAWLVSAFSIALALTVWLTLNDTVTTYSLFPLIGLITFGLMWSHYIVGVIRRHLRLSADLLRSYLRFTGYAILAGILAHPLLFEVQLFLDGLGLPPASHMAAYPQLVQQLAIMAGTTALLAFLAFELHRYFRERTWWKYIEYANILAMLLILWHGFILGGELRSSWFRVVWGMYALTFIASVAYSEYMKRKEGYARKQ